jgi:hypothetical protein
LAAGQDGHVLEHCLAPVAKAGRLHGHIGKYPPQPVDDERGEGLTFDVLGNDQQRYAALRNLLEQGQEVLHIADLPFVQQDQRVLEHGFHLLGISDEVRREIAAVELETFDDFHRRFCYLTILDPDRALCADLFDGLRDELANGRIVVR